MEHLDVVIVGAGISGIGCAHQLQQDLPERSFAIVEARAAIGGTWDLFRYPGVRSDSDVHTFGYAFRPWPTDTVLASGPEILDYIHGTVEAERLTGRIRLNRRLIEAEFDSATARWDLVIERTDTGEREQLSCGWLFGATGYYRYDEPYTPEFPNLDAFHGGVVHPQHWPEELDYGGKRVVVIGSGATAVTLVPALVRGGAGHVTMLQRSPGYVMSLPTRDPFAGTARRVLGKDLGFRFIRAKNILTASTLYRACRRYPRLMRRLLIGGVSRALPDGYDIATHFTPHYDPWDQRLCFVPRGDLFAALRSGGAEVVTGEIDTFTADGIRLRDGREVPADIVVTATGLNLLAFGGIRLSVDGVPVSFPDAVAFRGMMLSGVPNFAYLVGYTNITWTLKVGLVCAHFTRLLAKMDAEQFDICVARLPAQRFQTGPLLDLQSGYVRRALGALPRQGREAPWRQSMDYRADRRDLRRGTVDDPNLRFSTRMLADATGVVASDLERPA